VTSAHAGDSISRETILGDLLQMIADIVQDWDLDFAGGLRPGTRLVADLGFQSIDVVMLIGEIQKHYDRRTLPFERLLIQEGRYVPEIRIADVADFLYGHLGAPAGAATQARGAGGDSR
jgi:acyl carrier protein